MRNKIAETVVSIALLVVICVQLAGCVAYYHVRPQNRENFVWVCEEHKIYFWEYCPMAEPYAYGYGRMELDGEVQDLYFLFDPGTELIIYELEDYIKSFDVPRGSEEGDALVLLQGNCEFKKGRFVFTVSQERAGKLRDSVQAMVFVCYQSPPEWVREDMAMTYCDNTLS